VNRATPDDASGPREHKDYPVLGAIAPAPRNQLCLAPAIENRSGQWRRELATDGVSKVQRRSVSSLLPNTVVIEHDAAIVVDHSN